MVYSDINHISSNLTSLCLTESNSGAMEGGDQNSGNTQDSPNVSSASQLMQQQDNQNAVVMSPEEALVKLSEKTRYPIMQENGQRRYGPPPDWRGTTPARGCEVFIGKIPRDCFEDELVPIFETMGRIFMFRLMMDFSGSNRGYGFCIYTNREDTKRAVQELDNYEIRKGKMLGVCLSVDNCRLFVGGIPKTKTKEEIMAEMVKVTEGVKDVIVYPSAADKTKNRGFAFVEYENHKAAAMARRKLIPGRIQLWGHQIAVDWAEPEREVDEDIMDKVKILYVRNLMLTTTEETLRDEFNTIVGGDAVERVKKIRDYAFVHFKDRDQADIALRQMDDTELEGSRIEVTWAKPVEKSEYVRYTRGGKAVQLQVTPGATTQAFPASQIFIDPYLAAAYAPIYATTGTLAQAMQAAPQSVSPNDPRPIMIEESDADSDASNIIKTSTGPMKTQRIYRNAAGSRSAGVRNSNSITGHNSRDKRHPIEKVQQHQPNPINEAELLEELSNKNGWGTPTYNASLNEMMDPTTGNKIQLYIGQVTLPNICRQFQAPRAFLTPDESKQGAAEYALQLMQYTNQSLDNGQPRLAPQPTPLYLAPANAHSSISPFSQAQTLIAPGPYPTYTTYSYAQLQNSQTVNSLQGAPISIISHDPSAQMNGQPVVYADPNGLMASNQSQFINPMAFAGTDIYTTHY